MAISEKAHLSLARALDRGDAEWHGVPLPDVELTAEYSESFMPDRMNGQMVYEYQDNDLDDRAEVRWAVSCKLAYEILCELSEYGSERIASLKFMAEHPAP